MPRKKVAPKTDATTIRIENEHPDIERVPTGLYSLDRALGGGLPLRTILEISGYEYSGKSTLAYYLCGCVNKAGMIGIADFEGLDTDYIVRAVGASGFHGTVRLVPLVNKKNKPAASEEMLDIAADYLNDGASALLVDSIGAIYPVSEEEGNVGEGRVGRRAQIVAPFLRKCVFRLRWSETPAVVCITNHVHEIIGGRGTITAGGKAVAYLSQTRLRVGAEKKENRWLINGRIAKLRFRGASDTEQFQAVVVPGEGVHIGLSAVADCIALGRASEERTVSLNGKSYGYMSKIVENRNDPELFEPFHKALGELQ